MVVALPQLAEHNLLTWNQHWKEINFLISNLDMLQQNIIISLHPKMDRKNYEFLELKYTCKIVNERLSDFLPIADMFVATFSSTVVWAILCKIKTLVVDFYGLNYTMYDFLSSVKKVNNKKSFALELKNTLFLEVDFSNDWKALSRDQVFDGMTMSRYIKLIHEQSCL